MPPSSDSYSALAHVPRPAPRALALRVTATAEQVLRRGHPWLFASAVRRQSAEGRPGDLAVIFDRERRFLAVGLYDPLSPIRVHVLHAGKPVTIDRAWFAARLAAASAARAALPGQGTTGYRLAHGENDGLPGLVVDRYAGTLVVKLYTPAWIPHLADVLAALAGVLPAERVVLRLSRSVQRADEYVYGLADGQVLSGEPLDGPVIFDENRLHFEADPARGQKTGFFLDQRDNRARVETPAAGARVLNAFAYTGGFSLYAARGGARAVTSLDVSAPALAAAERNFALNRALPAVAAARHELMVADAFEALAGMAGAGRAFDLVIVDPPSFAKRAAEVERALAAYARLARLGLAVTCPGGTLVLASCSSRVSAAQFYDTVLAAAAGAGRPLRELARTGHALDHPVRFKEGEYLKCLFAVAP